MELLRDDVRLGAVAGGHEHRFGDVLARRELTEELALEVTGIGRRLMRVADGRTPVELARAFQVPKTTMTHSVGILEKHGLVAVRPNPNDGRSKCVWITDEGRALRDRTIAALAPEFGTMLAKLDTGRLLSILPVLTELRIHLDTHRNAEAPRDRDFR